MSRFTDCLGREWELRITRAHIPKLREAGFDLNATVKDPNKLDVLADPELMGKVLWLLCEQQADQRKLTPEQFAEGFDGAAWFAAQDAFGAAYFDFCHRPAIAAELTKKSQGVNEKREALILERIKHLEIPTGLKDFSPSTAESSESTAST